MMCRTAAAQLLARVPAPQLEACRRLVGYLDDLCSFKSAPERDYLDLNWWPVTLKRAWAATGLDARTLDLLRRGFDGDEEVNPAYRDHPYSVYQHPVTALEPAPVAEVAEALRAITPEAVHDVVPSTPDEIEARLGSLAREVIGDLADALAEQHALLRDFYDEAARRELVVVLWWD